jgi:hypothetical protein
MNCILKLWIILTNIGTHTTTTEGIFSDTTDGFRAHRQTYDNLTTHVLSTGSCARLSHRYSCQPYPLAPIVPLSAARGGPFRKRNACNYTLSRACPHNSGKKSETRYYVAFATSLSTCVSSSPTRREGHARRLWARRPQEDHL